MRSPYDFARLRRLAKEGLWVAFGQAMAVLGLLAGVRLLTELLDPTAYGELALGMTLATFVNQTIFGPLGNGVVRFFSPAVENGDLVGYLNAATRLVLSATGMLILLLFLLIAGLFIFELTDWVAIVVMAFAFALFAGCNSILSGIQSAARQRAVVALHQGIDPWMRFLIAAGFILIIGSTSAVAMAGYTLALFFVFISQFFFFRRSAPPQYLCKDTESAWRHEMWAFSWPISIFGFFTWMQLASDRWALNTFSTTQEVGLYAILFQLGYYPISLSTAVGMQLLAPIFYQRAGDGTDPRRRSRVRLLSSQLSWIILLLIGILFFSSFLFHAQIFALLAAKEYAAVSYLLPWMLLAGGVFAAGQFIALDLMSQMKTRAMIAVKITTALLGTSANIMGAYWYGMVGVVAAWVFFSSVYFFWMMSLSRLHAVRES